MTRTRIRDLIRKRLGETTASFWTETELNDWINDGMRDIAYRTKCVKKDGTITTTSSQEYTVSSSFPNYIAVLEVYMYQDATTWVKLTKTSRERLDREQAGWKSADSSVPQEYYFSKEEDVLGLYPKCNTLNQGTNYLEVYYADDSTDMSSDSDTPTNIPFALQLAIVDFAVATGYETRGYGDKANDAWGKYSGRTRGYEVERDREAMVDDELVMKNYKNI